MQRKALIVGIDNYLKVSPLAGCENDARAFERLIEKNEDGTPNYDCHLLIGSVVDKTIVSRGELRTACQELFAEDYRGDVLLYFSGHGAPVRNITYLATSDAVRSDYGIPMDEILQMACLSEANDILIIFDCCHSGDMGSMLFRAGGRGISSLRDNMSVMAASLRRQSAMEQEGHGLFTSLLLEALDGAAADHLGLVTSSSMYAYVERHFDSWSQRPMYKSNTSTVTTVRRCLPLIVRAKLEEMIVLFEKAEDRYRLDPKYEPEDRFGTKHAEPDEEKIRIGKLFKDYRNVGLLRSCEAGEQLFWTAQDRHEVELTLRGKEYWRLIKKRRI